MRRHVGRVVLAVASVLFIAVLVVLFQRSSLPQQPPSQKVGVVLYGQSSERWSALEQGIGQACGELSLEKPLVSLRTAPGQPEAEDQLDRIRREVEAGADGLLIAAADSEGLEEALAGLNLTVPVVMVETGTPYRQAVSAGNAAMGRTLAQCLAEKGIGEVVAAWSAYERGSVRERHVGFVEEAEALGITVETLEVAGSGQQRLELALNSRGPLPGVLVVFDNDTLEAAGALNPDGMMQVYGVGASGQVIHLLDKGQVQEVCYQNEFAIGYTALMQLAQKMGLPAADAEAEIEYQLVGRDNLYDPAVERLVFPIIQ